MPDTPNFMSDSAQYRVSMTNANALRRGPAATLLRAFNAQIAPIVAQLKTLTFQILRAARDLLLPRLMSGEIPV